jgi:hypothetical protein
MNKQPKKIGDLVRPGTSDAVTQRLGDVRSHFLRVCQWITENRERTQHNVTLYNLLSASSSYLGIAAEMTDLHPSVLALCTRSVYELNLRARLVLSSPDRMSEWEAEAAVDKIQVLEGILQLKTSAETEDSRKVLEDEIARIQDVLKRHEMPQVDHIPGPAAIAEEVGLSDEHKSLFKLFSKLVHPSSFLVNDYSNAASSEVLQVLQIALQLYAGDLFHRICKALSIPDEVANFWSRDGKADA